MREADDGKAVEPDGLRAGDRLEHAKQKRKTGDQREELALAPQLFEPGRMLWPILHAA